MKTRMLLTKLCIMLMAWGLATSSLYGQYKGEEIYHNIEDDQEYQITLPPPPGVKYKKSRSRVFITLDMGEQYIFGRQSSAAPDLDFSVQLDFIVNEKNDAGEVLATSGSDPITLVIKNNEPKALYVYNTVSDPEEIKNVVVIVDDLIKTLEGSVPSDSIRLSLHYEVDYFVDVTPDDGSNKASCTIQKLTANGQGITSGRVQEFSWTCNDFTMFQFELLRLYNQDETIPDNKKTSAIVDWSKALHIDYESIPDDGSSHKLTISVAEGTGFYVWRVRPVGNYYKGGFANALNYGNWNANAPRQDETVTVDLSDANSLNAYFYLTDPDENTNWIYSRVFTENNRMSEQITYANGLNQVQQTQTHLFSDDSRLITQSVQDYSGRPRLVTMPVPVTGGLEGYENDFLTSGNQTYTANHFDSDSRYRDPAQVDSSGAFSYYSNKNDNLSLPSSQGYPYAVSFYTNDGTGRVVEQTSPGRTFAVGEQADGKGRTVRTLYGNPSEEELVRVFGDEAPSAESVLKTITIDQNNTASVTYASKEGNTIASCMTISNDDNLDNEGLYASDSEFELTTSITENRKFNQGFISSRKLNFSEPTPININYTIFCPVIEKGCQCFHADCGYQVKFTITNVNTGEEYESNFQPVCDSDETTDAVNDVTFSPEIPTDGLPAGTYMFRKIITSTIPDQDPMPLEAKLNENAQSIEPLVNVFHSWLRKVRTEEAMLKFYEDVQRFGDRLEQGHTTSNYQKVLYPDTGYYFGRVRLADTFQFYAPDNADEMPQHEVKLTPEFNIQNPDLGNLPHTLTIGGGCCGDIEISVKYHPPIRCYKGDFLREHPDSLQSFWGYMQVELQELINDNRINLNSTGGAGVNIIPGYTRETLDSMMYYMLTDKYYSGPTILKDGVLVKPNSLEPVVPGDNQYQYACKDLWKCWKSVVASVQDMIRDELKESTSVHEGAEEEEPGKKDDHVDDGMKENMGWFARLFTSDEKISDKVREAENVQSDGTGDHVEFEFNIIEQFFNCAGQKFAAIVTKDDDENLEHVFDEDEYGYSPTTSDEFVRHIKYNDPGYHTDLNADDPCLPAIKNPVYAYKYFQYDEDYNTDTRGLEVAFCYDNYKDHETPVCQCKCGSRDYINWSSSERDMFYQALLDYEAPQLSDDDYQDDTQEIIDELYAMADKLFGEMKDSCDYLCESRRQDVYNKVKQAFIDNCYQVGGCPTNENVVLEEDILQITGQMIDECKTGCNQIFTDNESEYPMLDSTTKCKVVNADGTGFTTINDPEGIQNSIPVILPECSLEDYKKYKNWEFVFALQNDMSLCDCGDDFDATGLDPQWTEIYRDRWNMSGVYVFNGRLNINARGEADSQFVAVFKDDFKGGFSASVRIDSTARFNNASEGGIMVANNPGDLKKGGFVKLAIKNNQAIFMYDQDEDGIIQENEKFGSVNISQFPCWLRIDKEIDESAGDTLFTGWMKTDPAADFTKVASKAVSNSNEIVTVSLYTIAFDPEYHVTTYFDDFDCGTYYPNLHDNNDEWINNEQGICDENGKVWRNEADGKMTKYSEPVNSSTTIDP